jgi:glyoxylate reductase
VTTEELPRVFVARRIPSEGLLRIVDATKADIWQEEMPAPRDELLKRVPGVDGILSLVTDRVDDEVLDAAGPQLKVVSNYAVGFDNIDVAACTRHGVAVGNTPGVLTETTADLAFGLMMAAARRLVEGADYVRRGHWQTWSPMLLLGPDIHHATLGIVGFGRIGREMARRARGFDMRVLYHDVQAASPEDEHALGATRVDLDTLLAESDFVTLHVNLTEATRHLMNAERLAKMKRGSILVNAARGPVVDPVALYEALATGTIAGAALDVTEPEPIRPDDPLLKLHNCLIVPHIASGSFRTRGRMAEIAADNLLAGVRGERLPACVNPEVYA